MSQPIIQVLSFNIHKGRGFGLKRDRNKIDSLRQQIRLLDPDIIFLQEVCGSQFEYLAHEIWPHYSYGKNVISKTDHHGNAILSKFPISHATNIDISTGAYEGRGLLHAIVSVPHVEKKVHLICSHLGLLKRFRQLQMNEIIHYIKQSIQVDECLIMGGDFNDWQEHASEIFVQELQVNEVFLCESGKHAKTFPAWLPLFKLDRIYSRGFKFYSAERLTHSTWKALSDHLAICVHLQFYG